MKTTNVSLRNFLFIFYLLLCIHLQGTSTLFKLTHAPTYTPDELLHSSILKHTLASKFEDEFSILTIFFLFHRVMYILRPPFARFVKKIPQKATYVEPHNHLPRLHKTS